MTLPVSPAIHKIRQYFISPTKDKLHFMLKKFKPWIISLQTTLVH